MTFQRSLYISILFHVLIFGSAIAFAQLNRGALWGHRDVIMISLVGAGSEERGGGSQKVGHHGEARQYQRQTVSHATDAAAIPAENPSQGQPAPPMLAIQEGAGPIGDADGGEARKGQASDAGEPAAGTGARFGLIPPEQWTVIESALERSKTYPRMARERGIEGVVHVRFRLKPSGDVDAVEIVRSSGYDILDSASIRTVYRAAPMPYVNGWVEVPMAYVLK